MHLQLKQSFKCQKQENVCINPYLPNAEKFKIFEDTSESKVFNDENLNPAPSREFCPSPECIDISPNVLKGNYALYNNLVIFKLKKLLLISYCFCFRIICRKKMSGDMKVNEDHGFK